MQGMKQTKKGNEWHFGMKAHRGVDTGTGMVHSVEATGDTGYSGIEKRERRYNMTNRYQRLISGLTSGKERTGSGKTCG